jgi:hypothetical protein
MKQAFFAALLLSGVLSTSAFATPLPEGGLTPDEVVAWLQSEGYTAHTDLPAILSYADHHLFFIYLHDCRNDRCRVLQFVVNPGMTTPSWPCCALDARHVEQWNSTSTIPIINGYLSWKLGLFPGATYEQLGSKLDVWHTSVNRYYNFARTGTLASN